MTPRTGPTRSACACLSLRLSLSLVSLPHRREVECAYGPSGRPGNLVWSFIGVNVSRERNEMDAMCRGRGTGEGRCQEGLPPRRSPIPENLQCDPRGSEVPDSRGHSKARTAEYEEFFAHHHFRHSDPNAEAPRVVKHTSQHLFPMWPPPSLEPRGVSHSDQLGILQDKE